MKKIYLILFTVLISSLIIANEGLVINPVSSDHVDIESLKYFEIELNKALSSILEIDVIVNKGNIEENYRYCLDSELKIDSDIYIFDYHFYDKLEASVSYKGSYEKASINDFVPLFKDVIKNIQKTIRSKPVVDNSNNCQIVIEADIIGADIYINNKFVDISPIIVNMQVGDLLEIEARNETLKKSLKYTVENKKLKVISLELEPITGSFLLKGDVLGRLLTINSKEFEITTSSLFQNMPIGTYSLHIESEWGTWEDEVIVQEDKLLEIDVNFKPISRIKVEVIPSQTLMISDLTGNPYMDLTKSEILVLEPGEYRFETYKEDYISVIEKVSLDTGILHEYKTPLLTPLIRKQEDNTEDYLYLKKINFNKKIDTVKKGSYWAGIGAGSLFALGVIGEVIIYEQYNNSNVSSEAVNLRETGEALRGVNIAFLSTSILSWSFYFGGDHFKKEVVN